MNACQNVASTQALALMPVDLGEFMELVGARVVDVSTATGLHGSTIVRVRDREHVPDGTTLLKLLRWSEGERRRKGLPASKRLSFDYLLDGAA